MATVCTLLACGFEWQKASGSWKPAMKDKNPLFIPLYIRWVTKSIPNPKEIWHGGKASCAAECSSRFFSLSAHTRLTNDANDFVSAKSHKREKLLLAAHLCRGFSLSRKRAVFRGTKVSEKTVKFLGGWAKLAANEAVREGCRSRFDYNKYSARLTTNHAKMAPSTNPARTSVKKCLLSAIRLHPTNRDNETATTCSNGLSNLVSVLTAAWRYN